MAAIAMAGRCVQALGWVAALPLVATRLSGAEQGYYYTFSSLIALQVFVELGITGVIVQSLAHEVANLRLNKTERTSCWEGPEWNRRRLSSIMRFVAWWFGFAGLGAAIFLSVGGYFFLSSADPHFKAGVQWVAPWLAIASLTGGMVLVAGIMAVLEGLGSIGVSITIRLIASFLGLGFLIFGLMLGAGLWSVALSMTATVLVSIFAGCWHLAQPLRATLRQHPDEGYCWRNEIWPFQWRIAISWMAGWFIFQAMTPAILKNTGPEAAGRIGLALQVATGIQSLAGVWIQIRVPSWGGMIARREWSLLDADFRLSTIRAFFSAVILSMIAFALLLAVGLMPGDHGTRIPFKSTFIPLLLCSIFNQFVFACAFYLRAHKKEPFLLISISAAVLMALALSVNSIVNEIVLPVVYMAISFFTGVVGGGLVWHRCRKAWH